MPRAGHVLFGGVSVHISPLSGTETISSNSSSMVHVSPRHQQDCVLAHACVFECHCRGRRLRQDSSSRGAGYENTWLLESAFIRRTVVSENILRQIMTRARRQVPKPSVSCEWNPKDRNSSLRFRLHGTLNLEVAHLAAHLAPGLFESVRKETMIVSENHLIHSLTAIDNT